MKRWKLYFAYSHLQPHLQAVSKPFHDLAARCHGSQQDAEFGFTDAFCALRDMAPVDAEEFRFAKLKLEWARREMWRQDPHIPDVLRLVIEAKDCAVRAHIPDPPAPAAG